MRNVDQEIYILGRYVITHTRNISDYCIKHTTNSRIFRNKMTIIKGDVELQIKTLKDAGLTGYKIAKQLNLKMSTVYDFLKKVHLSNNCSYVDISIVRI